MCCPAARCGANCWWRCVRRARRAGRGHEAQTAAARSPTSRRLPSVPSRWSPARCLAIGKGTHQGSPQWVGRWHPGGADDPPGHPGPDGRSGYEECPRGLHEETSACPCSAAENPDLYDRGKEMAEHEQLAQWLAIQIFFADPYSSWQRGTNQNTDGLLRQTCPKARTCRAASSTS